LPEATATATATRKRAVPAARTKTTVAAKPAARKPATRAPRAAVKAAAVIEDERPTPNYALRLTEDLDVETPETTSDTSFELRLSEAINAISAIQGASAATPAEDEPEAIESRRGLRAWLAALDKLPPIRLPIGPAIPWRIGLPVLGALMVLIGVMSHATAQAEPIGVQLPAQPTYAAEQAPLFASETQAQTPPAPADTASAPATPAQPIGVPDSPSFGFDLLDIGIKLIAVVGLAYGSLLLLKRFTGGGARGGSRGDAGQNVRVVSSITLAPNRSVHVLEVPGGKTLLVGATPTSVNLLTELDAEEI
jgi:hypothetical protein